MMETLDKATEAPCVVDFSHLRHFILFVGYPRSGHSLVGSLIDAHPHAIIAHEFDILLHWPDYSNPALSLVERRDKLFTDLYDNSKNVLILKHGRKQSGYEYTVPSQHNGRYEDKLLIIGDKKGGATAAALYKNPGRLDELQELVGVPIKLVHVIRNPFDAMASHVKHKKVTTTDSEVFTYFLERFESQASIIQRLKEQRKYPMIDIRSEDLITDAKKEVQRLFTFLELPIDEKFLQDAAGIVFTKPSYSRKGITWREEDKNKVADLVARTEFFHGYEFDIKE